MPLVLTIVRQPEGASVSETRMLFNESGGTLGRAADNSWSLPDPSRFVSSHHASIRYDGGDFYLVDTSTNGVFVNSNTAALGTGNQVKLQQGDKLYLGEYEIHVEFEQSSNAANMSADDFDQWLDPQTDAVSSSDSDSLDLLTPEQELLDPLAALDKAGGSQDQWQGASLADNAAVPEQAFVAPEPIPESQVTPAAAPASAPAGDGMIPDDWDIDDLLSDDYQPKPAAAPEPIAAPEPAPVVPDPVMPSSDPIIPEIPDDDLSVDLDALLETSEDDFAAPASKAEQESDELDAFLGLDEDPAPEPKLEVAPAPPPPPLDLGDDLADLSLSASEPPPAPDLDDLGSLIDEPAVPPSPEPTPVPPSPPPVPESLISDNESQPAVAVPSPSGDSCDELIRSLGLDPSRMNADTREHFQRVLADTLRETVGGMMKVLGARNAIKNEFRMNVTMIQPMENNPLKFSPNTDEALRNMFTSQSNAYLPGTVAIREGFQDVADHQVAVIAGMRAAFRSLLKRFEPAELQVRFDKRHQAGGFLASKKGKYWEAYGEFYNDLSNNMDDAFQDLFGEDFAEAYEQQMGRLEAARKK